MSTDGLIIGDAGNSANAGNVEAAKGEYIKETTTAAFMADVIEASKEVPVLVDFWAPWCGPCRDLTPRLEKAVNAGGGRVRLVKLNIDDHPQIPGQLGIQSIPAVIAFKDGQPLDGFMGAVPESQITAFIERIAGPPAATGADDALAAAESALERREFVQAAELYGMVLQQEPENFSALGGLMRCQVELGNLVQARGLLAAVPDDRRSDPALAGAVAALDLAEKAATLGGPDALQAKVEAEPDNHQARFELALALNADGDRAGAVAALLEIVRRDREWDDDGARKQLLTFFEAWGPNDPASQSGRQRLSSVLFA